MHFRTHVKKEYEGRSGQGFYNDAMVYHDDQVGVLLKKLDDLGIADNTIVMYSTDNGPHFNSWPDAGITPFRSEKNTNWEGAFRVPAFVRWPGKIPAGTVLNGIVSHQDWLPTLLAAAGEPDIKEKLLVGHKAGARTFKVCIDGFNMLPYLTGAVKESPREAFFYVNDDAQLVALRFNDWKLVFMEQRAKTMALWAGAFRSASFPQDIQSSPRSLRARGRELEHLLGLDIRPRLPVGAGAGVCGAADPVVQGIPTPAEAGVVQPGPCARATARCFRQRHALSRYGTVWLMIPGSCARHIPPGVPFIMLQAKSQTINKGGYNYGHLKNTNREQLFPA